MQLDKTRKNKDVVRKFSLNEEKNTVRSAKHQKKQKVNILFRIPNIMFSTV